METREIVVTLWPWIILTFLYGGCVGSFLNVVIYRLPAGESLVRPGSHCPQCGRHLRWFENIPVISWAMLRARCRSCRIGISVQYPLVEALCAVLYGVTVWIYFSSGLRPTFFDVGFYAGWPVLLVHLVLIAALLAASVVDLKLFIIPLDIPWLATAVAVVALPVATLFVPGTTAIAPGGGGTTTALALGGTVGLVVACVLLRLGVVPQSFAQDDSTGDPNDHGTPEQWLAHPHPRREVARELLFVLWPLGGAALGVVTRVWLWPNTNGVELPPAMEVLGGVLLGYLVGGGLIWGIRIVGTMVFGKEAMGLGDVHVLAAIGAVFGWWDALIIFFLAPFAGLAGAAISAGVGRLLKGDVRAIPYGPSLAVAAIIWTWFQVPLGEAYATLFGHMP